MEKHAEGRAYILSSPTIRCIRIHLRRKGGRMSGKAEGRIRLDFLVSGLFSLPLHILIFTTPNLNPAGNFGPMKYL